MNPFGSATDSIDCHVTVVVFSSGFYTKCLSSRKKQSFAKF